MCVEEPKSTRHNMKECNDAHQGFEPGLEFRMPAAIDDPHDTRQSAMMLTRDLNQGPSSERPLPLMIQTELRESWTRPCRIASTSGVGVLLWLEGWVRVPS